MSVFAVINFSNVSPNNPDHCLSSPLSVDDSITPEMSASLKKALSSIANICPPAPAPSNSSSVAPEGAPGSPPYNLPATPSLRIQRPTVRISSKKPPLNAARSTENLLSGGPGSPLHHRPSSRSGVRSGIRPPSRSGMLLKKKSSDLLLPGKHGSGVRLSRSHQPSPAHRFGIEPQLYDHTQCYFVLLRCFSRETSPHRPSSRQASGRVGVPTKETMLSLYVSCFLFPLCLPRLFTILVYYSVVFSDLDVHFLP